MRKLIKVLVIILTVTLSLNIYSQHSTSSFNEESGVTARDTFIRYQNEYEVRDFTDKIELYGKAVKVPVLMYHHLLEAKDKKSKNSLVLTTKEFEKQMEYLFRNDYTTISIRELELFLNGELTLPKRCVLITFDDGYKSAYVYAYPILKEYGFKASVSLIPKYMPRNIQRFNPKKLDSLSWQEVFLGNDVFEYVNHTYSHISMKGISYKQAKLEIKKVNEVLRTKYFVYPVGHTSVNSDRALRELNYKLAFTTKPGFVRRSSSRLYLPRQRVYAGMSLSTFAGLLQ